MNKGETNFVKNYEEIQMSSNTNFFVAEESIKTKRKLLIGFMYDKMLKELNICRYQTRGKLNQC